MSKLMIILLVLATGSCGRAQLPVREVRVVISPDGKCLIDGLPHDCATIGTQLTKAHPKNEMSVVLDVAPQAEYAVLASVLASIRSARIEKTSFTSRTHNR